MADGRKDLRETCNAAEAAAAKAIQYDTKYYSNFINLTYQNTRLLFAVILPEMSEMSMSVGNKVFCRISWLGRFIVEKNIMLGMVSMKTCDKLDASFDELLVFTSSHFRNNGIKS